MKNNIWFIIACVLVFFVGYNINDAAVSFPRYKVAVVDVSTILTSSPEIQSLKQSQDKKMEELNTLISKAQNEIVNESDKNKALQMVVFRSSLLPYSIYAVFYCSFSNC